MPESTSLAKARTRDDIIKEIKQSNNWLSTTHHPSTQTFSYFQASHKVDFQYKDKP